MMCAVLAGSMQSAWGMANLPMESQKGVQVLAGALDACDREFGDWSKIPEFQEPLRKYDIFKQGDFSQMTSDPHIYAKDLAQQLDAMRAAYRSKVDRALVGAKLFTVVRLKYKSAGIGFEQSREFRDVASNIAKVDEIRSRLMSLDPVEVIDLGIAAGYLAKEMDAALKVYEINNNNKK